MTKQTSGTGKLEYITKEEFYTFKESIQESNRLLSEEIKRLNAIVEDLNIRIEKEEDTPTVYLPGDILQGDRAYLKDIGIDDKYYVDSKKEGVK